MDREKKMSFLIMIIIGILLVSMVCLCAIYLFSFESDVSYDLSKNDVNRIKAGNARISYSKYFNELYILPDKICICSSTVKDKVMMGFKTQMQDLYRAIVPLYDNFFVDSNYITTLNNVDGSSYYNYMLSSNGILIVWDNPLPLSTIYYMSLPENINDNINDSLISKMLFYGENTNYTCVLVDTNDNFIIYRHVYSDYKENPYYSVISNVSDIGMVDFEFGFEYKSKGDIFSNIQDDAIITNEVQMRGVYTNRITQTSLAKNEALFEKLRVNIVKATSYVSDDNTIVYMQEGRYIYIEDTGRVKYVVDGNNGTYLSDLINANANYEICDYIGASLVLINEFDLDFGEGDLYINHVSVDNGHVFIRFGLRYDNTNVVFDNSISVLSFEFENNLLKKAQFNCITIEGVGSYNKVEQYGAIVESSIFNENNSFGIVYILQEQTNTYPSWVGLKQNNREGKYGE